MNKEIYKALVAPDLTGLKKACSHNEQAKKMAVKVIEIDRCLRDVRHPKQTKKQRAIAKRCRVYQNILIAYEDMIW